MNRHSIYKTMSQIFSKTGILIILSSLGVFIFEVYLWLKTLHWTAHRVVTFVPSIEKWLSLQSDWHGLKKIVLWSLQCPLALFLLIFGVIIFVISTKIEENNL